MDKKEKEKELQRLVSLTFDENPAVRREAALRLAESNEPTATFALVELSYDKDPIVKATVKEIFAKKQSSGDKEMISLADLFDKSPVVLVREGEAAPEEPPQPPTTPEEDMRKKQLLSPIEQIFEKRLGKNKAALVKDRMMATIEKIYLKAVGGVAKNEDVHKREKSMQKMLTSYADALSAGLDYIASEQKQSRQEKLAEVQTVPGAPEEEKTKPEVQQPPAKGDDVSEVLDEVGVKFDSSKIARDLAAIQEDEQEVRSEISGASRDLPESEVVEKSIFRKAYDLMMATDGDEEVMYLQSQKLIKQLQDEVNLAFKMAKQRFKAENITHLTELRNGMRNINTDVLVVKSVNVAEYMRTKTKKDTYSRIVVNDDEGSEGVIYLFEGRGREVGPGMRIKLVKGQVKTFDFSKETALTVSKNGSVYIVL